MKHDRSITLPDPTDLINAAATSVIAAGALLRAEFHRPGGPRGSHSKAPIDNEIEEMLRGQLTSIHPCDWHGEELPREDTGHPDVWVVDPQDGTGDDEGGSIVRTCLEHSICGGPAEFMRNQGWVLTALGNAFHRLWAGQSLEDAVIETVAAGGDTDTNAAICGALLGAAQGRDAIPLRWRRKILACRAVPAAGVQHPRPPVYWPDDAMELAEALFTISQCSRMGGR